jgi:hypothetical protein
MIFRGLRTELRLERFSMRSMEGLPVTREPLDPLYKAESFLGEAGITSSFLLGPPVKIDKGAIS